MKIRLATNNDTSARHIAPSRHNTLTQCWPDVGPASQILTSEVAPRTVRVKHMSNGRDPFNPDFTIVIIIHYKSRIAVAILDL